MSGFTVTALTTYVQENADKIYTNAALGAQTIKNLGITIQAGIKSSSQLMNFVNTAPFQADTTCGFNASGSSTFDNRQLTVTELKWNDTWCPKDLQAKFTSTKLAAGAQRQQEVLPFEEVIMGEVMKNLNSQLEYAIWQGDTTNHVFNTNLKQFNGFLQVLDAASPTYATATAAVTSANVISILDEIYETIPAALINNPERPMITMVGWDVFRALVIAAKTLNYYHFDPAGAYATGEITMPGTGLKVKAVNGLTNFTGTTNTYKDRMVCTYADNLVYGTDLEGDYEDARVWYSQDDDNIKGFIRWKSGVQIARPAEVISYKNS